VSAVGSAAQCIKVDLSEPDVVSVVIVHDARDPLPGKASSYRMDPGMPQEEATLRLTTCQRTS
jgi:hypothetical protein